MRRYCRILFIALVAAGWLGAQEDAIGFLRRVSERYKALTRYHFESTVDSELKGELIRHWSKRLETLAVMKPDKARFESTEDASAYIVVSDGKTLWRAAPYTREFSTTGVAGPLLETKGGGSEAEMALRRLRLAMSRYERLADDVKTAQAADDETLEVGGTPVECAVIRAVFAPPRGAVGIKTIVRTYWIDKARLIVLQAETVTRGSLVPSAPFYEMESRYLVRYTVASVDGPVPESFFAYEPPANFREVDKLTPAFPRPATDLIGKPAPALALPALDGRQVDLASLRGKVVLLDFWATWCAPCRDQMPAIAKLYRESKDQGLVLLGVSDDEKPEQALQYLKERGYDWPNLFDGAQHEARERFKVDAIPTLVLIDKQGVIVEYQIGSGASAEAAIRAALKRLGFLATQ